MATTNQISYWKMRNEDANTKASLQETKRSNLAKEAETNRANLAKEKETARHNFVTEKETNRSNLANEWLGAENANIQRETNFIRQGELDVKRQEAGTNWAKHVESARHNKAYEDETHRHNVANEWLEGANVAVKAGDTVIDAITTTQGNVLKTITSLFDTGVSNVTDLAEAGISIIDFF